MWQLCLTLMLVMRGVSVKSEELTLSGGGEVLEAAGHVPLTITRLSPTEELVVTASVAASGLDPATADDVNMTAQTLTFDVGTTTITFDVVIYDDNIVEADEEFNVTIDAGDTFDSVETAVIILNDDLYLVTLPSFMGQEEHKESKKITITRNDTEREVTVLVSTADVTATAGTDYISLTNLEVTFAAGSETAIFTVDILDDGYEESDETFTLVVSGDLVVPTEPNPFLISDDEIIRLFDCRRRNQNCRDPADLCISTLPVCKCVGTPEREGDMCNIITEQKNGSACVDVDCNNNGVCLDDNGNTSCACYPGYYGDNCQHVIISLICSNESMLLLANPHGNFTGRIFVEGKWNESECNAHAVPEHAQPGDNIDGDLEGFYIEVPHDSETCGAIALQQMGSGKIYHRQFFIQYDPISTNRLDQLVDASCKIQINNLVVTGGVININPNGKYPVVSPRNRYFPLVVDVNMDGEPIPEERTMNINETVCVTINILRAFGAGIEMTEIKFNNSLPDNPERWTVYSDGCVEDGAMAVLVQKPYYVRGSKRDIKFCFLIFKFYNSPRLSLQATVRLCPVSNNCQLECIPRRKRQVESTELIHIGATFNVGEPTVESDESTGQDATDVRQVSSDMQTDFVLTLITLGCLTILLLLICLVLICMRVKRRRRTKKIEDKTALF